RDAGPERAARRQPVLPALPLRSRAGAKLGRRAREGRGPRYRHRGCARARVRQVGARATDPFAARPRAALRTDRRRHLSRQDGTRPVVQRAADDRGGRLPDAAQGPVPVWVGRSPRRRRDRCAGAQRRACGHCRPQVLEAAPLKPLDGIKVLDLSRVLAGPWCTQLLADLGAEVIKIERPGAGDDTRHWGPPWHGEDDRRVAAYFLSCNRGKKSAAIDFAKPGGAELVRKLAVDADVVVENFRVGGLAKFGLDAASLRAANPGLVYASI